MGKKQTGSTKFMVLAGVFAAVTAVLSQISVPLPSGVPVTLQTFAVALAAYVLGARLGAVSIGVYILLGAVGVPVFAGFRGGIGQLAGMTGGFIWGFLLMAICCGLAARKKHPAAVIVLSLLGLAGCHIPGVIQFAFVSGRGLAESFLLVSLPYLVKDVVSVALAWMAAKALRRGLNAAGVS
jgi:biotin transport system substrate-specific component